MALDQIWKRQLALVTYGNQYLTQEISFSRWVNHAIFNQHAFGFRDLMTQHLLAQHFQIWLEALKKQGVQRISLHSSSILSAEKNPNANVELLPIAHFIVSHKQQQKTAWILGKELAEWYSADQDYDIPRSQQAQARQEIFWRFELNPKLAKQVEADLQPPNWDDIQLYTDNELFDSKFAKGFVEPTELDSPYYGLNHEQLQNDVSALSLLPTDYQADYAHQTLLRLDALDTFIQDKIQHPYNAEGEALPAEEQLNMRHFSQKLDDLRSKFIVKVANHYKTARLTVKEIPSPLDDVQLPNSQKKNAYHKPSADHTSNNKTGVFALIVVTIIICLCGYYFGL